MPLVNGKEITPDAAIALGLCPETGISLKGVHILHHIQRLWGNFDRHEKKSVEAMRRMALLRQFAKDNPDLHPKYDDDGVLVEEAI